ncbi:MAG: PaaX family transcriptional regulator C-terminal domain-containing protein [Acidimicrobiales bacterium]
MMEERKVPGLRPLTARSVVLSTLLGTHPPHLPVRNLIRVGELFGIAEGTIRVALSRMVAAGDVAQDDRAYRLAGRLLERQARQDESRSPRTRPWRGEWEIAVVTAERRPAAQRVALRQAMLALRLAELREGTWLRPANLVRTPELPAIVAGQCTLLRGRPVGDATAVAAALWDLEGWAARAAHLQRALRTVDGLADGFMVSAAVLHHLLADPVLPPELLPDDWPGPELRRLYDRFDANYRRLLREYTRT